MIMPSSEPQLDRFDGRLDRDPVVVARPAFENGDFVITQVAAELDEFGRVTGYSGDLVAGLIECRGRVDAEHPAWAAAAGAVLQGREAGDHAGVRGASHRAHDDRVEVDAELLLLLGDLECPIGEAESAERVLRSAGRDAVRRPASSLYFAQRVLPGASDADVEAGRVQPHVRAHDA